MIAGRQWPCGLRAGLPQPPGSLPVRYPWLDSAAPVRFSGSFHFHSLSALGCRHHRLSFTPSPVAPTMCDSRVRLPGSFPSSGLMCGAVASGGFCQPDFLRLPCPPGPQGFLLRAVARLLRPCLFSTTRESVSLCPPARFGVSLSSGVFRHESCSLS